MNQVAFDQDGVHGGGRASMAGQPPNPSPKGTQGDLNATTAATINTILVKSNLVHKYPVSFDLWTKLKWIKMGF